MTQQEINGILDGLENLWFQNLAAKLYLKEQCGVSDPDLLLQEQVSKIPPNAFGHQVFAPVRQVIGQSLQDSVVLQALLKALEEFSKA